MPIKSLLLLTIITGTVLGQKAHYIIVHGTWAQQEAWAQPGGDFFERVEKKIDSQDTVESFNWSGKNKHSERFLAAQRLASRITSLSPETAVILIAHSHGSNVCFLASQILSSTSHYGINAIYALGAPINPVIYQPNMLVIGHVYNIFSFGDPVQTVSNTFERALPPEPHITNINILCNQKAPSHSGLHTPLVAGWVASHALGSIKIRENVSWLSLKLFDNKPPVCTINNQLPALIENEKRLYATISTYLFMRTHSKAMLKKSC